MMAKVALIWGLVLGWLGWEMEYPVGGVKEKAILPLTRYDFDSLRRERIYAFRTVAAGEIKILERIKEVEERRNALDRERIYAFRTSQFEFISEGKRITGMMNIPSGCHSEFISESEAEGILKRVQDDKSRVQDDVSRVQDNKCSAVIMIRGYADKAGYYSGFGTWKVADELAKNGFVTVSIDFLGYGGSDEESLDILEARFEKVVGVLDLIESVKQLGFVDQDKIGMWAHSNGGQIALSVLEITGKNYPTVLWAPMTQVFPQSVLETADDLDDAGMTVKKAIAEFEKRYDSRRYAFENYLSWIQAMIVIYQGTADEWCKVEWQTGLQSRLLSLNKQIELKILPGDDHNLSKSWEVVVGENVEWYRKWLE